MISTPDREAACTLINEADCAPALAMRDRTSKSHLRTRSRRTRCACASAAARRGRPAHRAARISDARQTLDTQWLNGVSAVLAGGLRPPARTLRLPRTYAPALHSPWRAE